MIGKEVRLKHLIPGKDGKFFGLTVDHAIARGVIPGLDSVKDSLARMIAGRPNAVTMHKGIAENCFLPYAGSVALSIKLTTFGVYHPGEDVQVTEVEEAIAMGADAVSIGCIVGGDNQPQQLAMMGRIVREAHRFGMPVICHIYPRGNKIPAGEEHDTANVIYAARTAAEIGADIIKTTYTGSRESFSKVVEAVPTRVAIAGDTNCHSAREFFQMTRDVIDSGAVGVTYGRFVFQYPHITPLVKTLSCIIHNDYGVGEAMEMLSDLENTPEERGAK